jgi:hypothetical protein
MNYTIIGYTEDNSHRDRCGDWVNNPGSFQRWLYRDDEKAKFINTWARLRFESGFEELIIMLNGAPYDQMTEEEFELYEALEAQMQIIYDELYVLKVEQEKTAKLQLEAQAIENRRLAVEKERARDLKALAVLQKKLGLSS